MKNIIERIGEFNRFGSKLGLDRMEGILEMLGNPQDGLKVIHVGGTNGKGSTCRFIYSGLIENGYKVGLYSSPYIERFTERIEINREEISEKELEEIGNLVITTANEYTKKTGNQPTEFEIVTIMAFVYFAKREIDFVILEVGLGGRGDSTNVIKKPLITAITSISYDHMDRLGETLEEISFEKAGIIKAGVPVVVNVTDIQAKRPIARKAYEENTLLYDISKIKYAIVGQNLEGTTFNVNIFDTDYSDVRVSMLGRHQVDNALTALACIEILRKNGIIKVRREELYRGFAKASNKGRLEILNTTTQIVLDGAHNFAAFKKLNENLRELFPGMKPLVVIGMLEDKVTEEVMREVADLGEDFITITPNYNRALNHKLLEEKILDFDGKKVVGGGSVEEGKVLIRELGLEYDYVVVTGSLYYIGEMLDFRM